MRRVDWTALMKRERAATALTYGLVVGLIALGGLAAVTRVGAGVESLFGTTSSVLAGTVANDSAGGEDEGEELPSSCSVILEYDAGSTTGFYQIDTDGAGPNPPFSVWCNMDFDGGGWTAVIAADQEVGRSKSYLDRSELTEDTVSNFQYSAGTSCNGSTASGISWGGTPNPEGGWERSAVEVAIEYQEVYVEYSGFYNCPSDSQGSMSIGPNATEPSFIVFNDAWRNDGQGQSLFVVNSTVLTEASVQVVDRVDQFSTGHRDRIWVTLGMGEVSGYSRRYIRNLWVRN